MASSVQPHVKAELHDVAVVHHVVLALHAHLARPSPPRARREADQTPRSLWSGRERAPEEVVQRGEVPFGGSLVVGRGVGHGVAVGGALVDLVDVGQPGFL